jgi:UDP-glucuronate decarboxylase
MWLVMNKENFVGPVNIGNPQEFTVLELAEKIMKKLGSKKDIIFEPLPSDDPTKRKPDITLAKKELNWNPKVSLDEGLDKTIEYFRRVL